MMMKNKYLNTNLHISKKEKNDEFYTQIIDIENECQNYTEYFKNKIIYLCCDNPDISNFWFYFKNNFKKFEIKKLISTYYNKNISVYKTEYDGKNINKTLLNGNGDFRSQEIINIMIESDIIITNPPFSLFRVFVDILIENNKNFLIIGHQLSLSYLNIFNYIKNKQLWLGFLSKHIFFKTPDNNLKQINVRWFTNLKHNKQIEKLKLTKKYNPIDYPKYDNYDAINVNKLKDIPMDYDGVMGVPITFLNYYNSVDYILLDCFEPFINGVGIFKRISIKKINKNEK